MTRSRERRPTPGSPNPDGLDLAPDVQGFFADLVGEATEERGVEATQAVTAYLAGMLAEYARPGALTRDALERPFTFLLAEALDSSGPERFERLRALGDGTLYVCGFFSEHLATRGVALRYVSSVGARAYDGAASMLRRAGRESSAPDVFGELAQRFDAFVELIECIADRIATRSAASDGSVLRLYERWLRTGSKEIAAALGAHGLVPLRGTTGVQ